MEAVKMKSSGYGTVRAEIGRWGSDMWEVEKGPLKLCPVARTRLTERTVVPRTELGKAG